MKASKKYGLCIGGGAIVQFILLLLAWNATFCGDHWVALPIEYEFAFPSYFVIVRYINWSNTGLVLLSFAAIFLLQWLVSGRFGAVILGRVARTRKTHRCDCNRLIVADSDADSEFNETVNKSKAMLKAIALAESFQ